MRKLWLACAVASFFVITSRLEAKELYLLYNINSKALDEINVSRREVARIFDDEFGPASDELPEKVKESEFFVSLFPNKSYVFMLNMPYNCGRLGCNTLVYERDDDGDLVALDSGFPLKCRSHDADKLVCVKGGYEVEKKAPPKKKGPVHYPAPRGKGTDF